MKVEKSRVEAMRANPWFALHMGAELDYSGGEYTFRAAASMVVREWLEYGSKVTMPKMCRACGQETWFRPTVLGYVCPACRDVMSTEKQWEFEDLVAAHMEDVNRKLLKLEVESG